MVFLSYARKDGRDAALRLKSELESNPYGQNIHAARL